jgi:HlyD family secretion protein/epimerase transport system membrane fusion protein
MALKLLLDKLPQISVDESGESTRLVQAGLFFGVLLFLGLLLWGMLAPINGAVVTSGTIKIDVNRKTLQHLEGGIVKEILVKEGSRVEKGQTLLILEDISTHSQFSILKDRLYVNQVKEARLQSQKINAEVISFPKEITETIDQKFKKILSNEIALFNSTRKSYVDQIKLLTFEIQQIETGLKGSNQEMEAIKAGIGFLKKQLKSSKALKKKGYVEDTMVWEQEQRLAEKREKIGSLLALQASEKIRITDTQLKIITLENQYIHEADDQLKETQKELLEVQELLRPAKRAFERSEVIAPLSGQIINFKVNTIGGVVRPGEDLLEIVPNQKELIISAKLETSDIDSVHLDQLTNIQLLAYSSRKTPMLTGKVSYISEDVIEDTVEPGKYYYLCHIKVDEESLSDLSEETLLLPGMPITAFIQTRARTFIDFVLEPLISHSRIALREE